MSTAFMRAGMIIPDGGTLTRGGWRLIAPTPMEVRVLVQPLVAQSDFGPRVSFESAHNTRIEPELLELATCLPDRLPDLQLAWRVAGGDGVLAPIFLVRDHEGESGPT